VPNRSGAGCGCSAAQLTSYGSAVESFEFQSQSCVSRLPVLWKTGATFRGQGSRGAWPRCNARLRSTINGTRLHAFGRVEAGGDGDPSHERSVQTARCSPRTSNFMSRRGHRPDTWTYYVGRRGRRAVGFLSLEHENIGGSANSPASLLTAFQRPVSHGLHRQRMAHPSRTRATAQGGRWARFLTRWTGFRGIRSSNPDKQGRTIGKTRSTGRSTGRPLRVQEFPGGLLKGRHQGSTAVSYGRSQVGFGRQAISLGCVLHKFPQENPESRSRRPVRCVIAGVA